ncbi:radical SAM protein [Catenulispora sp. NL8]|uniref:Radical SAM protein n=1 Tax=Catenulispora pinistramenti TaxID=2705254 RepID=A0ABS5KRY9_9ACTN|nr:radical SAM protein [Catenulispora pinistramenti]MBS2548784.1 radical SAM protein [Catenulispora pinistramenti]
MSTPTITEAAGITRIETLYIQLLYRCQFRCAHCFHGDRLAWRDAYTLDQAITLVELMQRDYATTGVNLLGGEPFLFYQLGPLLTHTKRTLGMHTEICTNGYRVIQKLAEVATDLDLLRVSLEGLEQANDAIRHRGSFREAIAALAYARNLKIATGVTMTVTATNIADVVPLARLLETLAVRELKLHHLRPVGYASRHTELVIPDPIAYQRMREQIEDANLRISVLVDDELATDRESEERAGAEYGATASRIESDPRGALTMSCNAVGTDAHAFYFDKQSGRIEHEGGGRNEVLLGIPPVVYAHA